MLLLLHCIITRFLDPVKITKEGQYNLNSLKEIKGNYDFIIQNQSHNLFSVTDSFLGLDEDDRGCQNEEPYTNCTTRSYLRRVTQKCGCLPFALGVLEVKFIF